jgi:hypothetical protein
VVRDVISYVSHKAQRMMEKESNRTLLTLNWRRRVDPVTKSIVTVSGETIDKYARTWRRLVCYAMCAYESQHEGGMDLGLPARLPDRQMEAVACVLAAFEEDDDDSQPSSLEPAVCNLVDSLVRQECARSEFDSILVSGMAIMPLDNTGGWKGPIQYNSESIMVAVVKIARYMLYDDSKEEFDVAVTQGKDWIALRYV